MQQAASTTSSMAIAGFVLSLVTLVVGIIPFVGLLGIITWPMGLIFSIVGLVQTNRAQGTLGGRGLAIAGIVISAVGIVVILTIVLAAVVFVLVSDLGATNNTTVGLIFGASP